MSRVFFIFLCCLFFVFSKQSHAAAAASTSVVEFHETEEYRRWVKLKHGVERHIAPFDLPPFFTTIIETQSLVHAVQRVLDSLNPKTLVGGKQEAGNRILSLVTGYEAREPKDSKIIKDRYGRVKEVTAPEMFSVPSKMDIFPTRDVVTKEGKHFTITNVSREDIYGTVSSILKELATVLKGR